MKNKSPCLVGLFGFWKECGPLLEMLLWFIFWVTQRLPGLLGPREGKGSAAGPGCYGSNSGVWAILGPSIDHIIWRTLRCWRLQWWKKKMSLGIFGKIQWEKKIQHKPSEFNNTSKPLKQIIVSFWGTTPDENKISDHRTFYDNVAKTTHCKLGFVKYMRINPGSPTIVFNKMKVLHPGMGVVPSQWNVPHSAPSRHQPERGLNVLLKAPLRCQFRGNTLWKTVPGFL